MISNKALELLENKYEEPYFTLFHKLGRGLVSDNLNLDSPHITASKAIDVWQINGEHLTQKKHKCNVLFDDENYLIQWQFKYVVNTFTDELEETLFYHWKGANAQKVFTPLPSEMEEKDPVVERLYQWSEPPVFFHIFQTILIVLNGKEEKFDPLAPRLFMVRGELKNEIHLFEVPYENRSFRSRTIFFSVVPKNKKIYSWHFSAVDQKYKDLIMNQLNVFQTLKLAEETWNNFDSVELPEGQNNIFEIIEDKKYQSTLKVLNFTPRLFYIYFIDKDLFGAEVEYPLKSVKCAPFPFLQTHLYTATQPALFLLDNYNEIWLWKGPVEDTDEKLFEEQFHLAEKLVSAYCKEKERIVNFEIAVKYAVAGSEPVEFTNIFPVWETQHM